MASLYSRFFRFFLRRVKLIDEKSSLDEIRRRMANPGSRLMRVPKDVKVEPGMAGSVPSEWITPSGASEEKVLLYIHGGAWIIGSTKTHRSMVSRIAAASKIRALSIDYRLAPEHPFPSGLDDCLEAYRWLQEQGVHPDKIVIAGDSAGGNLTLAVLLALKDAGDPLPAGAVGISPATDLTGSGESYRTKAKIDPIVTRLGSSIDISSYYGNNDVKNPLISPLYGDLRGLPPILIHVGEDEVLLDDSIRFVERACVEGVDAKVVVWKGMWHVFQVFGAGIPEARQSIREIGEFVQAVTK